MRGGVRRRPELCGLRGERSAVGGSRPSPRFGQAGACRSSGETPRPSRFFFVVGATALTWWGWTSMERAAVDLLESGSLRRHASSSCSTRAIGRLPPPPFPRRCAAAAAAATARARPPPAGCCLRHRPGPPVTNSGWRGESSYPRVQRGGHLRRVGVPRWLRLPRVAGHGPGHRTAPARHRAPRVAAALSGACRKADGTDEGGVAVQLTERQVRPDIRCRPDAHGAGGVRGGMRRRADVRQLPPRRVVQHLRQGRPPDAQLAGGEVG